MNVKNFHPETPVAYYIPCEIPLFNEVLKIRGCANLLHVMSNITLFAVPSYSRGKELFSGKVEGLHHLTNRKYGVMESHLGVEISLEEESSLDSGMEYIDRNLRNGLPVIANGTSYFLPHSKEYHSDFFISNYPNSDWKNENHSLLIHGKHNDLFDLYDPVPFNYNGTIPIEAFKEYWSTDRSIPTLAHIPGIETIPQYSHFEVNCRKVIDKASKIQWIERILKTIIHEYHGEDCLSLDGKNFHYGKGANRMILEDLKSWLEVFSGNDDVSKRLLNLVFTLRFSRFFLRDLVNDIFDTGRLEFKKISDDLEDLIKDMIKTHTAISMISGRSSYGKDHVIKMINELKEQFNKEEMILNQVNEIIADASVLESKEPILSGI